MISEDEILNQINELRSDAVRNILASDPSWIIKWGMAWVLGILILLVFVADFIEYPDSISGEITLKTKLPTITVKTISGGQIQVICVEEGQLVHKGDRLVVVSSVLSAEKIDLICNYIRKVEDALMFSELIPLIEKEESFSSLGEIQSNFNLLLTHIIKYNSSNDKRSHLISKNALTEELLYHQQMLDIEMRKKKISESEYQNNANYLIVRERLYKDNIISKSEFLRDESSYHQAAQTREEYKAIVLNRKLLISKIISKISIFDLEYSQQIKSQFAEINATIRAIKNQISTWKESFTLRAPNDGRVQFFSPLSNGDFLTPGSEICIVVPGKKEFLGQMEIAASGFGKLKIGQKVIVRLDSYPFEKFGTIDGRVSSFKKIPKNIHGKITYNVTVSIPTDLRSVRVNSFKISPNLTGTAVIITAKNSVLERLINKYTSITLHN